MIDIDYGYGDFLYGFDGHSIAEKNTLSGHAETCDFALGRKCTCGFYTLMATMGWQMDREGRWYKDGEIFVFINGVLKKI